MAKYMRDFDSEIFDEDTIDEAVNETIDDIIIEEAIEYFSLQWLFEHLTEEGQDAVYTKAREIVIEDYFIELNEEEEDDD